MNEHLNVRIWDKNISETDEGESPVGYWREIPDVFGDYQAHAYRTYGEPFSLINFFRTEVQEKIQSGEIIVSRFTGMKDTRGTPIYEGDILQEIMTEEMAANGDSSTLELVFFVMGTYFIGDLGGPFYDHVYSHSPDILQDYVVVGNKFETPELLLNVSL